MEDLRGGRSVPADGRHAELAYVRVMLYPFWPPATYKVDNVRLVAGLRRRGGAGGWQAMTFSKPFSCREDKPPQS